MIQERIKIQVQGSEDYAHLDTYVLGRYLDDDPNPKKPLVLICPGGAYKDDFKPRSRTHCLAV